METRQGPPILELRNGPDSDRHVALLFLSWSPWSSFAHDLTPSLPTIWAFAIFHYSKYLTVSVTIWSFSQAGKETPHPRLNWERQGKLQGDSFVKWTQTRRQTLFWHNMFLKVGERWAPTVRDAFFFLLKRLYQDKKKKYNDLLPGVLRSPQWHSHPVLPSEPKAPASLPSALESSAQWMVSC